jgi:hypothetical protein
MYCHLTQAAYFYCGTAIGLTVAVVGLVLVIRQLSQEGLHLHGGSHVHWRLAVLIPRLQIRPCHVINKLG